MIQKNEKGLKPWLFRSVAVLMGICYLMAPLQHEFTEILHFFSHALDPGTAHHSIATHTHFNHQAQADKTQTRALSHSTEAHNHTGPNEMAHLGHTHTHDAEPHTHEIIDFMSMVLSATSPTHNDNDNIKVPLELDKHIVVAHCKTSPGITIFTKSYFSNIQENTSKGIHYPVVPPPKPVC